MGILTEELLEWNSPSVGAYLLWRFTTGYSDAHPNGDAPVALLHFLAAPILRSATLLGRVSNRRKSLQSFVRGFVDQKNTDLLVSMHDRVKENLPYTMAAIDIAVSHGLLAWEADSGKLHAHGDVGKPRRGNALKQSCDRDGKKAEILGSWFAEHDIPTVATHLKVL